MADAPITVTLERGDRRVTIVDVVSLDNLRDRLRVAWDCLHNTPEEMGRRLADLMAAMPVDGGD